MKALSKRLSLLFLVIGALAYQITLKSMEGKKIIPGYTDFEKWLESKDRSYYTLIGANKDASIENLILAINNASETVKNWKLVVRQKTLNKQAAIQLELDNTKLILTLDNKVKEQYDNITNQNIAKKIAFQKLGLYYMSQAREKQPDAAIEYCTTIINSLKNKPLYDPIYNQIILDLLLQIVQQYVNKNDLPTAENKLNEIPSILKELLEKTDTTFNALKTFYPKGLVKDLENEINEYKKDIQVDINWLQNKLNMMKTIVKEKEHLREEEAKKKPKKPLPLHPSKQEKKEDEQQIEETIDLLAPLIKLNHSLKALSTTLEK